MAWGNGYMFRARTPEDSRLFKQELQERTPGRSTSQRQMAIGVAVVVLTVLVAVLLALTT